MRNRIFTLAILIILSGIYELNAQVSLYGGFSSRTNISSFLDVTSNPLLSAPNNTNLGKGLIFPRTNLTQFANFATGGPTGFPSNFNNNLDGFLVYNKATGTSLNGGQVAVTPGFYYYENNSTTINTPENGTWVRLLDENDLVNVNSAHDSDWLVAGGTNIPSSISDNVYTNGNVGIGIPNPTANLDIASTLRLRGGNPGAGKILTSDANGNATWQNPDLSGANNIYNSNGSLTSNRAVTMNGNIIKFLGGNLGIGTHPNRTLDVVGTMQFIDGNQAAGKVLTSDANGNATWQNVSSSADNLGNHTATQNVELNGNWLSNDGGNEGVAVANNGNVGVGTNAPTQDLDVNGEIRIRGGNPGTGKVLTSDNNGNASWQNPSGGGFVGNTVTIPSTSTTFTVTNEDLVFWSRADMTITLPDPSLNRGRVITFFSQLTFSSFLNITAAGSLSNNIYFFGALNSARIKGHWITAASNGTHWFLGRSGV